MNSKIKSVETQDLTRFITLDKTKYIAIEGKCMDNAILNKEFFFKTKNLKFKCGYTRSGFLTYGWRRNVTFNELKMDLKENGWDIHCWLEDAEGNVYDHIQKNWLAFNPGFKVFRFEGLSKEELKEFNMEYIAYDEIVCKCFEKLNCNKITIVHWN